MKNSQHIVHFLLLFITLSLLVVLPMHAEEKITPAENSVYTVINGEWQRTDGGYLIKVSDVQEDGQAKVEYFNPRPIHVARAAISTQKKLIKLFVQLQDKGYEGSTYTLYYYAEKDALAGFYYQAPLNRTFEVIFLRKINKK